MPRTVSFPDGLPEQVDMRLVVSDMDGTLIDPEGHVPPGFDDMLASLAQAGVLFVPASGRQMNNIHTVLGPGVADVPVIAENGTLVRHQGRTLHLDTISAQDAATAIRTCRELRRDGMDVGGVVATPDMAYVERDDEEFLGWARLYYSSLSVVPDLLALPLDDVLKVAVFDFDDVEHGSSQALRAAVPGVLTVASATHWTDMMPHCASKGRALAALQDSLGISPAQTVVFGDYLNDADLYDHAELSFAMANGHPQILRTARWVAPSNAEHGVLQVVAELLQRRP